MNDSKRTAGRRSRSRRSYARRLTDKWTQEGRLLNKGFLDQWLLDRIGAAEKRTHERRLGEDRRGYDGGVARDERQAFAPRREAEGGEH